MTAGLSYVNTMQRNDASCIQHSPNAVVKNSQLSFFRATACNRVIVQSLDPRLRELYTAASIWVQVTKLNKLNQRLLEEKHLRENLPFFISAFYQVVQKH